jgi:hypothetical protein
MPFPDPVPQPAQSVQQPASPSPKPPQTGADYNVERPSIAKRFVERVGGGVLGGMVSGAVRVGMMGFILGGLLTAMGVLIPAMLTAGGAAALASGIGPILAGAAFMGLKWGIAGAAIVGGFKLVTGLLGAAKDAIFNPNDGAKLTQNKQQEQAPGVGKAISPELSQALQQDRSQSGSPTLDPNATTQLDPNAPPPKLYAMTPEERAARRAKWQQDRQELEELRRQRDGGMYPPQQPSPAQQQWDNRTPIGFEQKGRQAPENPTPPQNQQQTYQPQPPQTRNPIGFELQGQPQQEPQQTPQASQQGEWAARTGRTAPSAKADGHWTDTIEAQRQNAGISNQQR